MSCLEVIVDEKLDLLAMAPTGSGKTAVALIAILQAFRRGKKAVYTSPIKARSNPNPSQSPSPGPNPKPEPEPKPIPNPNPNPNTSPIQALSNQKYAEFKSWFGARNLDAGVTLLTG